MLGALPVSEISCERKARLFVLSSQARPPSSKQSFQTARVSFTASTVFLLLSATVRPSFWTSSPPHIHTIGYAHAFGSLIECPKAWPNGLPLALNARPTFLNSSQVFGYSKPASLNQSSRYVTAHETMNCGTPIQRPLAKQFTLA